MVPKGQYVIEQVLNISHSLLSQKESEPSNSIDDIKKCLIRCKDTPIVVYFIDSCDIGQNSKILIEKDLECHLLKHSDFKIIRKEEYKHNTEFINSLIK